MVQIWRSSHKSKPILPDPFEFGWKLRDDTEQYYEAIMTYEKAASVSVVKLSFCSCKHDCETKRCTCKKNNLICSEMCFCQQCENHPRLPETFPLDDDEENENHIDDTYS